MIAEEQEYTKEFPSKTGKKVLVVLLPYGAFVYKLDNNYLSQKEAKSQQYIDIEEFASSIIQGYDEGKYFSYEITKRGTNVFDEETLEKIIKTMQRKFK